MKKLLIIGAILSTLFLASCHGQYVEGYLSALGYRNPVVALSQLTDAQDESICQNNEDDLYIFKADNGVGLVCGGPNPHIIVRKSPL